MWPITNNMILFSSHSDDEQAISEGQPVHAVIMEAKYCAYFFCSRLALFQV